MARQMVGQRKPGLVVAIQAGGKPGGDSAPSGDDDTGNGPDVDTCPNCGCEFDDDSGKIMKPGAKVVGGPKDYEGADLDASGSAQPVPGKAGTAHDAAVGDMVMGNLLANLKGAVRP